MQFTPRIFVAIIACLLLTSCAASVEKQILSAKLSTFGNRDFMQVVKRGGRSSISPLIERLNASEPGSLEEQLIDSALGLAARLAYREHEPSSQFSIPIGIDHRAALLGWWERERHAISAGCPFEIPPNVFLLPGPPNGTAKRRSSETEPKSTWEAILDAWIMARHLEELRALGYLDG